VFPASVPARRHARPASSIPCRTQLQPTAILRAQCSQPEQRSSEDTPETLSKRTLEEIDNVPKKMSERMSQNMPERISEGKSEKNIWKASKNVIKNVRRYARKKLEEMQGRM